VLSPAGVVLALLAAASVVLWPPRQRRDVSRVRPATPPRRPVGRGRGAQRHGPDPGSAADALVLLGLALRSGAGLPESLREVARGADGQVSRDLDAVVAALQWARPGPEAWEFAAPLWRPVSQAWEVAVQTGTAPAELVEGVAHRLRETQERERERRAARAGVLLVLPLGLCFLPAFVCTAVVPVVLALAGGVIGW
jgi:hypothetical protein